MSVTLPGSVFVSICNSWDLKDLPTIQRRYTVYNKQGDYHVVPRGGGQSNELSENEVDIKSIELLFEFFNDYAANNPKLHHAIRSSSRISIASRTGTVTVEDPSQKTPVSRKRARAGVQTTIVEEESTGTKKEEPAAGKKVEATDEPVGSQKPNAAKEQQTAKATDKMDIDEEGEEEAEPLETKPMAPVVFELTEKDLKAFNVMIEKIDAAAQVKLSVSKKEDRHSRESVGDKVRGLDVHKRSLEKEKTRIAPGFEANKNRTTGRDREEGKSSAAEGERLAAKEKKEEREAEKEELDREDQQRIKKKRHLQDVLADKKQKADAETVKRLKQ